MDHNLKNLQLTVFSNKANFFSELFSTGLQGNVNFRRKLQLIKGDNRLIIG